MNKPEILVIDDEEQIRKLLEITLRSNNYSVIQAATAKEGIIQASNHPPDLIILDLGLPDKDGLTVLEELRQWHTNPVIILSVQKEEETIIKALDMGANDYLTKPWRNGELLARIRSAIRTSTAEDIESIVEAGNLEINLTERTVRKNGEYVKLTTTEYNLLALFVKNDGKVLTYEYVLRAIWGPGFIRQSQYLRVFVAQLRKKIEEDPNRPEHLLTESGVGYRFRSKSI